MFHVRLTLNSVLTSKNLCYFPLFLMYLSLQIKLLNQAKVVWK